MKFVGIFVFIFLLVSCEAKGGRGGGGGGRSGSRGSSASSRSGPAAKTPGSNPSAGWNLPGNNKPVGAPPAYPGLANKPVLNSNSPPAYSQNFVKPPAYSQTYLKPNLRNSGNNLGNKPNYGSSFGSAGPAGNTYISNNYYGSKSSFGGTSFLTSALLVGAAYHVGYRSWDLSEDRQWRATTKAPYFENKVPGSDQYLPAAAVVGAATAFGLASLLPLNVPANKPLMYCNDTGIAQNPIKLEENIYSCDKENFVITSQSGLILEREHFDLSSCCDDKKITETLNLKNKILSSKVDIFCNSTTSANETALNQTILNCYQGSMSKSAASFIPTTESPVKKELSLTARMHIFFMKLAGNSDAVEKAQISPSLEDLKINLKENETLWIPEALTIPPETTTKAFEGPYLLAYRIPKTLENGTVLMEYQPLSSSLTALYKKRLMKIPEHIVKIPDTTEAPLSESYEDDDED